MKRTTTIGKVLMACGLAMGVASGTAYGQFQLRTELVASGMQSPLYAVSPDNDFNRIFVVEQGASGAGRIRLINLPNTLQVTPYLTVSGITTGGERGLLGLAFHPDFMTNGFFWVNYTNSAGNTVIARYRATGGNPLATTADPASATILLSITQDFSNHNGGWIDFGPDGMLYVGMGDGGSGNDPNNRGQSITSRLGKMLRIDVDGADNIPGNDDDDGVIGASNAPFTAPASNPFAGAIPGDDLIWMTGLRNPWRNSFDRLTGDFWIADVGQDAQEEVNFIAAVSPTQVGGSGANLGWRCMEGTRCTGLSGCTCNSAALTMPILVYSHVVPAIPPTTFTNGCSVTGGYVYRGSEIPCFQGHYIFADYCIGQIWTARRTASGALVDVTNRTSQMDPPGTLTINLVSSFGEDARGELYIVDPNGGELYRVRSGPATGADCNQNGIVDSCELSAGTVPDCNGNSIPDSCDIASGAAQDCNANGRPDSCDIASGTPDCNANGRPDSCDLASGQALDCNTNGIPDSCDIASGFSTDANNNGIPDSCEGPTCDSVDFNGDGIENDPTDIEAYLSVYSGGPCIPPANICGDIDFNNDGIENDPTDIESFLSVYSGGPCL